MTPRISVLINTLNEEANLPYCLQSVCSWADEIVVVDMHSDDATVAVAETYGARVFTHERLGYVEPARAFAIAQATGEWLLILDADEMIPAPLSRKLRMIACEDAVDVVSIPRLNYMFGDPLMHSGCGPNQDRQMRFFRREMLHTETTIHSSHNLVPGARVLNLTYQAGYALVHFAYLDFTQFIDKLNRYTSIEATQAIAEGLRLSPVRAVAHAALTFIGRYVYPFGFRDGWRGLYLSLFMAGYRLAIYAKATERVRVGARDDVQERYWREAERLLAEYSVP